MYFGQTVGWIEMSLGMEVGTGSGHIVLQGNPALPTEMGTAGPNFRPSLHGRPSQQLLTSCLSL